MAQGPFDAFAHAQLGWQPFERGSRLFLVVTQCQQGLGDVGVGGGQSSGLAGRDIGPNEALIFDVELFKVK